jgi:phosphoglycolate phosphatase
MLHELMDELGVPPEGTLMIGDTSHDMEMARAAHVDALAVTYGAHPEAGLRACRPLDCCADVVRLRAWLTANA